MKRFADTITEYIPKEEREILKKVKGLSPDTTRPYTKAPQTRIEQLTDQKKALELINAFYKAKAEKEDNPFVFTCPICGNDAKGGYVPGNNHFRIECKTCNKHIWQ